MLAGGGIKRSIEKDEDDDELEDADRCGKRTRFGSRNIGGIFSYEEESSPGIGNSMLKKKSNERDNITLINALNGTTNTGSVGGQMQYLDTNLANNAHNFANIPDSGYHSSGFPNLSTSPLLLRTSRTKIRTRGAPIPFYLGFSIYLDNIRLTVFLLTFWYRFWSQDMLLAPFLSSTQDICAFPRL